jgi:hypothetical protein
VVVLVIEFRTLCFSRQMLYNLSHDPNPFYFSNFSDNILWFCLGRLRPWSSYLHSLCSGDDRCTAPHLDFIGWGAGLANFLPMVASNCSLISASKVAGITSGATVPSL